MKNSDKASKEVSFDCPACGQNLEATEDMTGLFVECPQCAHVFQVPRRVGAAESPQPVTPQRDASGEHHQDEKGSTIRIELPPNLGIPSERKVRRMVIRRPGKP